LLEGSFIGAFGRPRLAPTEAGFSVMVDALGDAWNVVRTAALRQCPAGNPAALLGKNAARRYTRGIIVNGAST
jgi:hypothetical protein